MNWLEIRMANCFVHRDFDDSAVEQKLTACVSSTEFECDVVLAWMVS